MLLAMAVFCLSACAQKNPPDSSAGNEPVAIADDAEMERNYVYMWNKSGVGGVDKLLYTQTEDYALVSDAKSGAITAIGGYTSTNKDKYARADFDKLIGVNSMKYSVGYSGGNMTFNRQSGYHRVIESGRYVQRADYAQLLNSKDTALTGRMEIYATKNYAAITYEVHNGSGRADEFDLSYTMKFDREMTAAELPDGRGLTLKDSVGQGFTIMKNLRDEGVSIAYSNGELTVSQKDISAPQYAFYGFSVFFIPRLSAQTSDMQIIKDIEESSVTATDVVLNNPVPVSFDAARGVYRVDTNEVNKNVSQLNKSGRNTYDRVVFEINGRDGALIPITFFRNSGGSITGVSPMLRDKNTLEPTGIQVQASKNWHTFNTSFSINDPCRLYEGAWINNNVAVELSGGKAEYEYTCAYGEWGGVYAASHNQLCLIGWGGGNNLLWDESALGSWGESITYDPDMGLSRAMIDDVRPFLVKSEQGGYQQYNWTGNVGGANFLDYYPTAKQSKIIDQTVTYRSQAPNLTDVIYEGITDDGAIKSSIKINMGRTDDVVRAFYTLKYEFLNDTVFDRLSFFKMAADGYSDNSYSSYAIGDDNGILQDNKTLAGLDVGYLGGTTDAKSDGLWYLMYNSKDKGMENGDSMMVVREYDATINGKKYNKPSYRIFGTSNGGLQPSMELSLPSDITEVKAGSVVEMTIEYLIIPSNRADYYGEADYLLQANIFGTAAAGYDQVYGGKLQVNASVGKVNSRYPVEIEGKEGGETVAQFTISGGLGYVPVRITDVNGYKSYKLQKKVGGNWVDIVQNGNGANSNDFWQVYYNANTGKYEFSYNVKNTVGLDYGTVSEYRFIKA